MALPVIKSYPMSITYANARRIHISFPPRRFVRNRIIPSRESPILCHPLRIFISPPFFLLFYPYNKYARINQYFRGHFRFTRSMVGCFIYIYINVNVYTPVRIRISRVTVTVSLQRFLISRSNEALTHKGSPLTGWDFNEDIKVVSSRGVLRAARY